MQQMSDTRPAVELSWPLDEVACITLARGAEFNTLTLEMLQAFDNAIERAHSQRARVIIVTGEGRAFCGGAHVKYFTDPASPLASHLAIRDDYVQPIIDIFGKLQDMPLVTIAAINGFALGGGCELALSCDFRIISDEARIGLPEARLGAIPAAGGLQLLAKIVGRAKALEMILLGDQLSAQAAEAAGLVTKACAPDRLLDEALTLAERLLKCSPIAIAESKRAIYRCETAGSGSANQIALDAVAVVSAGADWKEGMTAFVEKRLPSFARNPKDVLAPGETISGTAVSTFD